MRSGQLKEQNWHRRCARYTQIGIDRQGGSLLWGVLGELDTLLNVALESLDASVQKLLLTRGDAVENVDGLFGTVGLYRVCQLLCPSTFELRTHSKLNGGGEEINAGGLGNRITAGNTGQVDECRLNNALDALRSLENGLGESSNN